MQASDFLKKMGLHEKEAQLYLLGLSLGTQATSLFAKKLNLPRSTTQLYLLNLAKQGYMTKSMRAGVQFFTSLPADQISSILNKHKVELEKREEEFYEILPELTARRNETTTIPDFTYYDGEDGIKAIYKDILEQKSELYLFQSPGDHYSESYGKFLEQHIRRQVQEGIHVRALTPKIPEFDVHFLLEYDKKSFVERRFTSLEELHLPGQILSYGDRVAIITGHQSRIRGFLIKDKDFSDTVKILFDYIWKKSLSEHKKVLKEANYQEDMKEVSPLVEQNDKEIADYYARTFREKIIENEHLNLNNKET